MYKRGEGEKLSLSAMFGIAREKRLEMKTGPGNETLQKPAYELNASLYILHLNQMSNFII